MRVELNHFCGRSLGARSPRDRRRRSGRRHGGADQAGRQFDLDAVEAAFGFALESVLMAKSSCRPRVGSRRPRRPSRPRWWQLRRRRRPKSTWAEGREEGAGRLDRCAEDGRSQKRFSACPPLQVGGCAGWRRADEELYLLGRPRPDCYARGLVWLCRVAVEGVEGQSARPLPATPPAPSARGDRRNVGRQASDLLSMGRCGRRCAGASNPDTSPSTGRPPK
jgi:hypothetical protein